MKRHKLKQVIINDGLAWKTSGRATSELEIAFLLRMIRCIRNNFVVILISETLNRIIPLNAKKETIYSYGNCVSYRRLGGKT